MEMIMASKAAEKAALRKDACAVARASIRMHARVIRLEFLSATEEAKNGSAQETNNGSAIAR
jgi:hypothetical protein